MALKPRGHCECQASSSRLSPSIVRIHRTDRPTCILGHGLHFGPEHGCGLKRVLPWSTTMCARVSESRLQHPTTGSSEERRRAFFPFWAVSPCGEQHDLLYASTCVCRDGETITVPKILVTALAVLEAFCEVGARTSSDGKAQRGNEATRQRGNEATSQRSRLPRRKVCNLCSMMICTLPIPSSASI